MVKLEAIIAGLITTQKIKMGKDLGILLIFLKQIKLQKKQSIILALLIKIELNSQLEEIFT